MVPFCLLRLCNWRMRKNCAAEMRDEKRRMEKKTAEKMTTEKQKTKKFPYASYHLLETASFIFAFSLFWWRSWFWFIGPRGIITTYIFFAFLPKLSSLFALHSHSSIHSCSKRTNGVATAFVTPFSLCDQPNRKCLFRLWTHYTHLSVRKYTYK